MNIEAFMQGYKAAWEARDDTMFATLFAKTASTTTDRSQFKLAMPNRASIGTV